MKLPDSVRPIWRTIQIVRVGRGLDSGLRIFILGPFFYDIFKNSAGDNRAMFYTSLVWAIYSGLIALFEIPTGALADVLGRARVITLHYLLNLIYTVGLISLIFSNNLVVILIISVCVFAIRAISFSLFNGSYSAWVVDSINEASPGFGYERLLARGHAYFWWSQMVGGVLGITMYLMGIPYMAFVLAAMLNLSCATYCIAEMREPHSLSFVNFKTLWGSAIRRLTDKTLLGIQICKKVPAIWWLLCIYAVYEFLLGVVGYLWPVTMAEQFGRAKWSAEWYLMVLMVPALAAAGSHILAWWGDHAHKETGKKMTNRDLRLWLIGGSVVAALAIMGLGILNRSGVINFPIFVFTILTVELTYGLTETCYDTLVHNYIPNHHSQERATVMSIGGMLNSLLLLVLLVPSSGKAGESSPVGWILPAAILLLVAIVSGFFLRKHESSQQIVFSTQPTQEVI